MAPSVNDMSSTTLPHPEVDDLSPRALLEAASVGLRARRAAEVEELRVAAQWAVLHGEPADEHDPMVQPGGEGTPALRELCLPELAMAREEHALTTRARVADVLDLQHRLPATWARVVALACEPWVARKVAVVSRDLPFDRVGVVDRAVAAALPGHAPSTVIQVAQAKVIEADPEAHAARREVERHRRFVSLSRCDEFGYRHVIARVTAGDAVWVDAMVDRVADILALTRGQDHNREELRSLAFGWLARPADLLRLLLEHTESHDPTEASDSTLADPPDRDDPAGRPVWAPADLEALVERLASMSTRQLAALRGRGVVFVHVTDRALAGQAGVARVEGQGPMLVQGLGELLGHADVRLQPVLDLRRMPRVDAYEHPERLKDQVWAASGGDVFPYAPRTATRAAVDFDHCTPYRPHGPPGQTGGHNSGPLRRRHHRWKTLGGYRVRQAGTARYLWQTPHGLALLVDGRGTHRLDDEQARIMLTAPEGVEIYFGELIYEPD